MNTPLKSTERFSKTVEHYVKYRPHYPDEIIDLLTTACNLSSHELIADIGSGTGILTKLWLENNYHVMGVEPNKAMRSAGEQFLKDYKNFTSIDGTAENTGLADHSIDLITVAQAFHWFDPVKVKQEFLRILKPKAWCVLLWNFRNSLASSMMYAYEELLLKHGTDYKQVAAENVEDEEIQKFFAPLPTHISIFENVQVFDWDGLRGRLLSTSYLPKPEDAGYEAMIKDAHTIFSAHQKDGKIDFIYDCKCYYGQLA